MKKIIFLIALFFAFNGFTQNQTHSDSVLNSLKVKRKVEDNSRKPNSGAL